MVHIDRDIYERTGMFTHVKSTAVSVKNHVKRNQGKYLIATSALLVLAVALQQTNLKSFYAFLEEKGIDPMEFYAPEYFAELNS
jgi:hypothetical protein